MRTLRFVIAATLLVAGLCAATQAAARAMDYRPALGGCVYRGDGWAAYVPWAVFTWGPPPGLASLPVVDAARLGFALYAALLLGLAARLGRGRPTVRPFGTGGWGIHREMRQAGLLNERGTVLGVQRGGRLLTYDGPEHQLVAGASRSGKGVGHVVPTLLCWPSSALVYDVKGELWDLTAGYRAAHGQRCLRFNPTDIKGSHFNPLLEVRKGPHEVRDVQNLVEMLVNPDGSKRTLDVWDQNASQFLVGLVLHVLYAERQKHLGRVRELLLDFDATCRAMMTTPHRVNPATRVPEVYAEVGRVAKSLLGQAERFRSSVRGTAEGYLTLWADEVVSQVTSKSDFACGDLACLDRPMTLYVQPPPSDAARVRPLTRLLLNQITRALLEHRTTDNRGRPKRHRLLVLLDEFPTLGRLDFFQQAMREMAGYGLKAQLVVQSFNDVVEQYGPHNTIVDNCHVLVAFASADTATQQRVSQMAGQAVEYRDSYSRNGGTFANTRHGKSQAEHVRPLLPPGEVRTLPYDEQLVFVTGFRPFRTRKLRYYRHPDLRRRAAVPPPANAQANEPPANDWACERPKGPALSSPADLKVGGDNDGESHRPAAPASAAALGTEGGAVSPAATPALPAPADLQIGRDNDSAGGRPTAPASAGEDEGGTALPAVTPAGDPPRKFL